LAKEGNVLLGILAIILGLLAIAFPLFSIFTVTMIAGIGILILGIWLLIQSFAVWQVSKVSSIAYLIIGITALIVGVVLFGNIIALSFLLSNWFYITGLLLILSGIMSLFTKARIAGKLSGTLGILMGIIYIVLASYAWNPLYLALLIGIWLIIDGVALFFITPK
jgi:membrane protein HdeD